jgi:hypothetical protein
MPKSRYFFGRHWCAAAFESDPRTKIARTTSINDDAARRDRQDPRQHERQPFQRERTAGRPQIGLAAVRLGHALQQSEAEPAGDQRSLDARLSRPANRGGTTRDRHPPARPVSRPLAKPSKHRIEHRGGSENRGKTTPPPCGQFPNVLCPPSPPPLQHRPPKPLPLCGRTRFSGSTLSRAQPILKRRASR